MMIRLLLVIVVWTAVALVAWSWLHPQEATSLPAPAWDDLYA